VHCPIGVYDSCLIQLSEICGKQGYSIQEKIRQIRSGILMDDGPEYLLITNCKGNAELTESGTDVIANFDDGW
jgi:hypothetical protein